MLDERVLEVLARSGRDSAPGRALFALAAAAKGARILEIGSSDGYSTLWLAAGARLCDGSVVALERDSRRALAWRRNLADAGLDEQAVLVEGDALQTLARLEERFSIVVIAAARADYELYFTAVRTLSTPGTVVVADGVLAHEGLAGYSARRQADPTVVSVTLPVGNGLELSTILTP